MQFLQIICLYNKKNIFLKNRFKTVAFSDGLTLGERKEIEYRGVDELLSSKLIDEKSTNIICSFKLKSGRFCLLNINKDFIHGFISESKGFPFYTAQIFGSESFIKSADIYRNNGRGRNILPSLKDISVGNIINFESVSSFIKGKTGGTLKDMINATISSYRNNKRIVICDCNNNLPYWIGAIQMAFPIHIANNIFFTTGGNINANDLMIIGSSNERIIKVNKRDESDFYLFDLNNNLKSVVEPDYKLNRLIEYGYLISRESVATFHDFISKFCYNCLDERMEDLYNFYCIVSAGIGNMEDESVERAVRFAEEFVIRDFIEDILVKIQGIYDKIAREINISTGNALLSFIFKGLKNSKDIFLINSSYKLLYNAIDNLVFEKDYKDSKEILDLYYGILKLSGDRANDIRKYFINVDDLEYITYRIIEKGSDKKAGIYLQIILSAFIELKYSWYEIVKIEKNTEFFNTSILYASKSKDSVKKILEIIKKDEDFLFEVLSMLYEFYNLEDRKWLAHNLWEILNKMDPDVALDLRKRLNFSGKPELLFEEFKQGLAVIEDKSKYFDNYYNNVVYKIPEYGKEYYSIIVFEYLSTIKDEISEEDYLKILENIIKNKYKINNEIMALLINRFEKVCSLNMPVEKHQKLFFNIEILKNEYGIETSPDITSYINLGIYINEISMDMHSYSMNDIMKKKIRIENLDIDRYKQYLKWCLPLTINFIKLPEDNKIVNYIFNSNNIDDEYYREYFETVKSISNMDLNFGYEILLNFIIYFFYYVEPQDRFLGNKKEIELVTSDIYTLLLKFPHGLIIRLNEEIEDEFHHKGLSTPILWKEIYNRLIKA